MTVAGCLNMKNMDEERRREDVVVNIQWFKVV